MEKQDFNQSNSNTGNDESDMTQGMDRAASKIKDAFKETFGMEQSNQQNSNN
ncbi:hypothetical protein [Bacillus sp. V5-8f]|uniref:hypothetical protein n=1 Tax=Bacillus sp. V5-8f TaxID=2053044 RepID=UPI0015E0D799|nr:hypothetical protein [Bacillus sp. V5-8f]